MDAVEEEAEIRNRYIVPGHPERNGATSWRVRPLFWWTGPAILAVLLLAVACNSRSAGAPDSAPSDAAEGGGTAVVHRFLIGGWINPLREQEGPFEETLRGFVITQEDELRQLLKGLDYIRLRGSTLTLDRVDYAEEVVLAVYHLWRPLKGDPLSIRGIQVKGEQVEIDVELLDDPLGREFPYLLAPFYIASIPRENLPSGKPISFVFVVNGKAAGTRTVTLE